MHEDLKPLFFLKILNKQALNSYYASILAYCSKKNERDEVYKELPKFNTDVIAELESKKVYLDRDNFINSLYLPYFHP